MEKNIEILYEDKDIIVCRKPAGVAVQSANVTIPDMESMLKNMSFRGQNRESSAKIRNCRIRPSLREDQDHYDSRFSDEKQESMLSRRGGENRFGSSQIHIIHRLDQPVEGIVVFGKNKKAAASLNKQVQSDGGMNKIYLAALYGKLPEDKKAGELRDYLMKDRVSRCAVVTDKSSKEAREAVLTYKVIGNKSYPAAGAEGDGESVTIVEIHLKTGRFHQIRAQFTHLGYPLLGDQRYGNEKSNALSRSLGIRNVALCAYRLSFNHPTTGKVMNYEITPSSEIFS